MRILKKLGIYIAVGSILLPSVLGVPFDFDVRMLAEVFGFFPKFFGNVQVAMGATIILWFMLLYSMFAAGMQRMSFFQKEGGKSLNNQGQIAAISSSLLSIFGMFFRMNPREVTQKLLTANELVAGALIGAWIFLLFWKGIGSFGDDNDDPTWPRAMIIAGVAMMFVSFLTTLGMVAAWGIFIILIGLIGSFLGTKYKERQKKYENETPNQRRARRQQERESGEANKESFADEGMKDIADAIRTSRGSR